MTTPPGSLGVITRAAPNTLKRAALVAALLVALGLGITLFLAATQWLSVWMPALIMVAASLPIAFVATVVSTSQEDEASLRRMVAPGVVALSVSVVLGVFGGFIWREDMVRLRALELASERGSYEILEQALLSGDERMAQAACGSMLTSSEPQLRGGALAALELTPSLTQACLGHGGLEAAERDRLADVLAERWWNRLVASEQPESACRWAGAMGELEEFSTSADVALLSCALSAEYEPARECCVQDLKARKMRGSRLALRAQAFAYKAYERPMGAALLEMSFESGSLKPAERARMTTLAMEVPRMRAYAIEVACGQMSLEEDALPIAQQFYGLTDKMCGLNASALKDDLPFWVGVCTDFAQEGSALEEATRSEEAMDRILCETSMRRVVGDAVEMARAFVSAGIRLNKDGTYTDDSRLLGSINRAASASGQVTNHLILDSTSQGQYRFESNDRGYLNENSAEMQYKYRQREAQLKELGYRGEPPANGLKGKTPLKRERGRTFKDEASEWNAFQESYNK